MEEIKISNVYEKMNGNLNDIKLDENDEMTKAVVDAYNSDNICLKWIKVLPNNDFKSVSQLSNMKSKKINIRKMALFSELQRVFGIDEYTFSDLQDIFASNPLDSLAVAYIIWFRENDKLAYLQMSADTRRYLERCMNSYETGDKWEPNDAEIVSFINDIFGGIGYSNNEKEKEDKEKEDKEKEDKENVILTDDEKEELAQYVNQVLEEGVPNDGIEEDFNEDLKKLEEWTKQQRRKMQNIFTDSSNNVDLYELMGCKEQGSVCLLDVVQKYVLDVSVKKQVWYLDSRLDLLVSIFQRLSESNPFMLRNIKIDKDMQIKTISLKEACLDEVVVKYQILNQFFKEIGMCRKNEEKLKQQYMAFINEVFSILTPIKEKNVLKETCYYIEQIYGLYYFQAVYDYACTKVCFKMLLDNKPICKEMVMKKFADDMVYIFNKCVRVHTRLAIAYQIIDEYYNEGNLYWTLDPKYSSSNSYNITMPDGEEIPYRELIDESMENDLKENLDGGDCKTDIILSKLNPENLYKGDVEEKKGTNYSGKIDKQDWYKWYSEKIKECHASKYSSYPEKMKVYDKVDDEYLRHFIGKMYECKVVLPLNKK